MLSRSFALISLGMMLGACGGPRVSGEDAGTTGADSSIAMDARPSGDASQTGDASPPGDAGAREHCDAPGTLETVACGSCGTRQRFCGADHIWAYGTCDASGECTPGAERTQACGNCGVQIERCDDACTWQPSGACTDEGECTPGERARSGLGCAAGQTRDIECDESCSYVPAGDCTDDSCSTPGTSETVSCGMCGTLERFCTAERVWSYGPCTGEGECAPGSSESVPCGNCGTRTARCTTSCTWNLSAACTGEGECAPGEMSSTTDGCPSGQSRPLTCSDACAFEPGACADPVCTPGETDSVACGMCGAQVRTCDDTGRWQAGPCSGEGVCVAGTSDTQPCGLCGTETVRCSDTCQWVPTGTCTGALTCTAADATCVSPTRLRVYASSADCSTRTCTDVPTDIDCPAGCTAGQCDSPGLLDGFGGPAGFGTNALPEGDDGSSSAIDLSSIFPSGLDFYGTTYTSLFVNSNGNLSFSTALATYTPAFPRTVDPPVIAAWWGDVDTRGAPPLSGVFWHADALRGRFIATWNLVGYYREHWDLQNSFQIILTDRSDIAPGDFDLELRYAQCEWTTGDASGGAMGLGGMEASAGFDAANGVDFVTLPGSGTAAILDLCTTSNAGAPGLFRYSFRSGRPL